MKDNISIIFAAIIGVFLIVILPLFSILDRQDSMSYNVVLTSTTNFVDNIRNNGFIDKESYNSYISALASTSNTYKVTIEAYRNKLIHDTDEEGNILEDRFVEAKELINTNDIIKQFERDDPEENVVLFNKEDEIYVKVRNTNMTAGSVMYRFLSGVENSEVININYGGVIKNINRELYNKIQKEEQNVPEVIMTVPVNKNGRTNVVKALKTSTLDYEYLEDIEEDELTTEDKEILTSTYYTSLTGRNYAYLYDLSNEDNKTIKIAVELKNIYSINTIDKNTGEDKLVELDDLKDNDKFNSVKKDILSYIEINGMYYDTRDISLRKDNDYYFFDITITGVRMSTLDFISSIASITILPGLGQDINGVLSLGSETVEIELKDENAVNSVLIKGPYNFKKLMESDLNSSKMIQEVFVDQDIVFVIQYTGIGKETDEIIEAIKQNLNIYEVNYENLEIITPDDFKEKYDKDLNLNTIGVGSIIVKFRYTEKNISTTNYIDLNNYWIENSLDEEYSDEELEQSDASKYAIGARSTMYAILRDDVSPLAPDIILSGTKGENDWYTSNVIVSLDPSKVDYIKLSETNMISTEENLNEKTIGGSGVYKNYIEIEGANTTKKTEYINEIELINEGETSIKAYAKDYMENESVSDTTTLKIDKTAPTKPVINITSGTKGNGNWYKSDVEINITPGTDITSGVNRTTFSISGANSLEEKEGTNYTFTKDGQNIITARTYDNAGNYSESKLEINIDRVDPPDSEIKVVSGSMHNNSSWYYTDVELKIKVSAGESVSGLGICKYRIKEKNSSDASYIDFNENEKLVTISESGEYIVTVIAYTKAGNSKTNELTLKIDKEGPKPVSLNLSGTKGQNGWYTSSVNVVFNSNGDNGPSGEESYIRYYLDGNETEIEIESGKSIILSDEKEHTLTVYSIDKAGNRTKNEEIIKIDKTGPEAQFNISGEKGEKDWYKDNVTIGYNNTSDNLSGINMESISLSHTNITEDTNGTNVSLSLKDNAGNETIKNTTIKLDKTNPTNPTISTSEDPTAGGVYGVLLFNKDVNVTITPGEDINYNRTTYFVKKDDVVIVNEQDYVSSYSITENGYYIITVRTYDDAGRYSEVSKTIYVYKNKPQTIVVNSINGENVKGTLTKTITGNDGNLNIAIENYNDNCTIKLILTNISTYEVIEKEYNNIDNEQIDTLINSKGKYEIKITQTNIFGSTSNVSSGSYYYDYI